MRVVQYADDSKLSVVREETFQDGYARGFDRFISFIQALIPAKEEYEGAARKTVYAYPELAIRVLVANALIHQDFSITGTGPLIEIFASRLEISNPGTLLVEMDRIIDNPARSRNEILAALMRQLHFCEESGTGWDKIALSCELAFIPSPRIDSYPENTKVTIFSETKFSNIPIESRIWSCYLHV